MFSTVVCLFIRYAIHKKQKIVLSISLSFLCLKNCIKFIAQIFTWLQSALKSFHHTMNSIQLLYLILLFNTTEMKNFFHAAMCLVRNAFCLKLKGESFWNASERKKRIKINRMNSSLQLRHSAAVKRHRRKGEILLFEFAKKTAARIEAINDIRYWGIFIFDILTRKRCAYTSSQLMSLF